MRTEGRTISGIVLILSPSVLVSNVHFGSGPTLSSFLISIPIGMVAYTGIETISNMAEEARDETRTVPNAIRGVVLAVFAIYAALPLVALSALPVHTRPDGTQTPTLATRRTVPLAVTVTSERPFPIAWNEAVIRWQRSNNHAPLWSPSAS